MALETMMPAAAIPAGAHASALLAVDAATLWGLPWVAGAFAVALLVYAIGARRTRRRGVHIVARPARSRAAA
jgi:hypothetical protein